MKHVDDYLIIGGLLVLTLDIITGYMKSQGTATPMYDSTLLALENKLPIPVPLWMGMVGAGLAIKFA